MVRMRNVDLSLFQFDYDLTWAAVFLEPDGTILGRYGAGARDAMRYSSIEGLKRTMQRILHLHGDLEEQRPGLEGKRDRNVAFKKAGDLPHDGIRRILSQDTHEKNCVHCHNVQEGLNRAIAARADYHPDMVRRRWPNPELLGVVLDRDHGLRIREVIPKSGASLAGLRPGDELVRLQGQVLTSPADVVWALRSVNDPGQATLTVLRAGKEIEVRAALARGWKLGDLSWRTSLFDMRPRLQLWVQGASQAVREKGGVADGRLCLLVRGVFGSEVRKAGLKKGDLITAVGKWRPDVSETVFHQHVRTHYFQKNARIPMTVKRKGRELKLVVKIVR